MSLFNRPNPNEPVAAPIDALSQPDAPQRARRSEAMEEKLKRRQAEIAARLHAIATTRRVENREREARLDRIIGTACRADKAMYEGIKTALKAVKSPADREFLKIEGWL